MSWMRGSEGGEEGRTNSFSGKSTYKKDVREGRGSTHEGEGRREANACGGESVYNGRGL